MHVSNVQPRHVLTLSRLRQKRATQSLTQRENKRPLAATYWFTDWLMAVCVMSLLLLRDQSPPITDTSNPKPCVVHGQQSSQVTPTTPTLYPSCFTCCQSAVLDTWAPPDPQQHILECLHELWAGARLQHFVTSAHSPCLNRRDPPQL